MPAEKARDAAAELLVALPSRWAHVQGVAEVAADVTEQLQIEPEFVVSAAWLHDIGHAPALVDTGLHALDGARYLRANGWPRQIAEMVAHHSAARVEAEERGLADVLLAEFPRPTAMDDLELLWYCDMTTGPSGERVSVEDRLQEIRQRYGPDALVTRSVDRAADRLVAAVRRVERRLEAASVEVGLG